MADTFRALCAELTERLDELNCLYNVPSQSDLIERALALLASDFRALCAELTERLDELNCLYNVPSQSDLIERSHTALAESDEPALSEPPADWEVPELVAQLTSRNYGPGALDRAAELLQRQVLVPVSVSERLPGPEDCNAEGKCWLCGKVEGDWRLINPEKSGVPHLKYCFTHWLPAHALPRPGVNNG